MTREEIEARRAVLAEEIAVRNAEDRKLNAMLSGEIIVDTRTTTKEEAIAAISERFAEAARLKEASSETVTPKAR